MVRKISITAKKLVYFQVFFNIFSKFLIYDMGFPAIINYISDVITVLLLIDLVYKKKKFTKNEVWLLGCTLLFFFIGVISAIINVVNPILIIWAIRNNARFILWIFIVSNCFESNDYKKLFNTLNKLLLPNFILMVFQYLVMGYRDDLLNGFFGSYNGGNSALNTFFVVLTSFNIASYLLDRTVRKKSIYCVILMALMSALNEIKLYYVELIIIVAVISLINLLARKDRKSLTMMVRTALLFGILCIIGMKALFYFYPGFRTLLQSEVMLNYLTRSYNSSGVLFINGIPIANRLTAYSIVCQFFLTSRSKFLFGIGLGANEYSSFFTGAFHEMYGKIAIDAYLLPNILLETGVIGASLYILLFLLVLGMSYKLLKKRKGASIYGLVSASLAILAIVINIYNSALKIESSGYLMYTMLAIPFLKNIWRIEDDRITKKDCI